MIWQSVIIVFERDGSRSRVWQDPIGHAAFAAPGSTGGGRASNRYLRIRELIGTNVFVKWLTVGYYRRDHMRHNCWQLISFDSRGDSDYRPPEILSFDETSIIDT